ncbi:hypothetical protein BJY00DRAFT_317818 [Aspergillus carlsbadensis]|nr:hypothetical protein BJY00DRAFT_317818 [Aspergillus carlsbadensis]
MALVALWTHLDGRRGQPFLLGAIILWAVERSARIVRILYRNQDRERGPRTGLGSGLRIVVYVTGSGGATANMAARRRMGGVQLLSDRPGFDALVAAEVDNQISALGVVCCGGPGFGGNVRRACREAQGQTEIVYLEERLTWS